MTAEVLGLWMCELARESDWLMIVDGLDSRLDSDEFLVGEVGCGRVGSTTGAMGAEVGAGVGVGVSAEVATAAGEVCG